MAKGDSVRRGEVHIINDGCVGILCQICVLVVRLQVAISFGVFGMRRRRSDRRGGSLRRFFFFLPLHVGKENRKVLAKIYPFPDV